jgi:hypothetical protein
MTNQHDEAVRVETIALLDAVEAAVLAFSEIFQDVAAGTPLDGQRAENLTAQCTALMMRIETARHALRLSGQSPGVH